MSEAVNPIPKGYQTLTPHLVMGDAAGAIEFYKRAFGAVELMRQPEPNGTRLLHAAVRIGDSVLMLADAFPELGHRGPEDLGGTPVAVHIYCEDVDAAVARAVGAGATITMPPADMFWGDRYARLTDPYGHLWSIATHVRDVTEEELRKGAEAAFSGPPNEA